MQLAAKMARIALIILTGFLALSAIPGGISLMSNFYAPSVDELAGSPFKDFTVPGLVLTFIVGGSALLACILLVRRNRFALLSALSAGTIVLFFEFVEILVIGSDPGVGRNLQMIYFGLGTLINVTALAAWFANLLTDSPS